MRGDGVVVDRLPFVGGRWALVAFDVSLDRCQDLLYSSSVPLGNAQIIAFVADVGRTYLPSTATSRSTVAARGYRAI